MSSQSSPLLVRPLTMTFTLVGIAGTLLLGRYWLSGRAVSMLDGAALLLGVVAAAVVPMTVYLHWARPARLLTVAAQRLAEGQWHARVQPEGAAELRELGLLINRLATTAQHQLDELGRQKRDLRSLVDTLPDPLLATDAAGRVFLINGPAAELLQLSQTQALGRKIVSVVNDEALLQMLDAVRSDPPGEAATVQREIRLVRGTQQQTYQGVCTPTATGGVLLLLRDVSTMADAVQMKTDFVANASHELRTPLAAIKIALETLTDFADDDPAQSQKCVTIINDHVRRLEEILRDLLDLSRLESPDMQPMADPVKPGDIFAVLRSTLGAAARQKLVELRYSEDDAIAVDGIIGDERLLHLVLKNLVENSIKFTPAGGTVTVEAVRGSADDHGRAAVAITVSDNGIGIPPEHRDRVFQRFYQVDPARSGTAGRGTGLGLAIVKHAVAAMGGSVRLTSEVGTGTTVTCVLPQPALVPSPGTAGEG